MDILTLLKRIFFPETIFREITEDVIRDQKIKLGMTKYKKWARRSWAQMLSLKMTREEKGLKVPEFWVEKINLLAREVKETEQF